MGEGRAPPYCPTTPETAAHSRKGQGVSRPPRNGKDAEAVSTRGIGQRKRNPIDGNDAGQPVAEKG